MTLANAEPTPATTSHAPPLIAILVGAFLVLCMVLPLVVVACSAWRGRHALRACPVCGDSAVRNTGSESVGFVESEVALQCGQCATWRRLVVNRGDERAHARRLRRERRRIRKLMLRLEAERRALDMHAFIGLLRADILGAQDFLAVTRPPTASSGARHHRDR